MSTGRETLEFWLEEPEAASQADLQLLAWHTVPRKGGGPQADLAEACAALLEVTSRPRAAAAMRRHSPRVLAAWARSQSAGFEAFVAANDATGVTPPDTPALAWATFFGSDEAAVVRGAEQVLERAVETGRLEPGGRRWRVVQREIMTEWLGSPDPELDGAVPVDLVRAERRRSWLADGPPARGATLRRAFTMVEPPPDPPPPLQTLLDAAREPIMLTAAHYVPPRIVGPIAEEFGWTFPGMPGRTESHIPQFAQLREFASEAGLLARRGRTLRLTSRGTALAEDPAGLAVAAATAWFGGDEFPTAVAEIAAAVLLEGPARVEGIVDVVERAVAPSFRTRDGRAPGRDEVQATLYAWIRPGTVLGWLERDGLAEMLTGAGRRAASEGVVQRSHAPRNRP